MRRFPPSVDHRAVKHCHGSMSARRCRRRSGRKRLSAESVVERLPRRRRGGRADQVESTAPDRRAVRREPREIERVAAAVSRSMGRWRSRRCSRAPVWRPHPSCSPGRSFPNGPTAAFVRENAGKRAKSTPFVETSTHSTRRTHASRLHLVEGIFRNDEVAAGRVEDRARRLSDSKPSVSDPPLPRQ